MNIFQVFGIRNSVANSNFAAIPKSILMFINADLARKGKPPFYFHTVQNEYETDLSGFFNIHYSLTPAPRVEIFKGLITFYLQYRADLTQILAEEIQVEFRFW